MEALGKIINVLQENHSSANGFIPWVDQSLLSISRFLLMNNISKSTACTAKTERKSIVKYRKRNKSNSIAEAELSKLRSTTFNTLNSTFSIQNKCKLGKFHEFSKNKLPLTPYNLKRRNLNIYPPVSKSLILIRTLKSSWKYQVKLASATYVYGN